MNDIVKNIGWFFGLIILGDLKNKSQFLKKKKLPLVKDKLQEAVLALVCPQNPSRFCKFFKS